MNPRLDGSGDPRTTVFPTKILLAIDDSGEAKQATRRAVDLANTTDCEGKYRSARHFKMQYYQGRPALTWWEGRVVAGHGVGEYVIFDGSYHEIARVRAGNGYRGDLHEFLITPQDTALLTAYVSTPTDLTP